MVSKNMYDLGNMSSGIRDIAEYGAIRKMEIGEDAVFDFSLGNPSVPTPGFVSQIILELLEKETHRIHGYTPAPGDYSVRKSIIEFLNQEQNMNFTVNDIYLAYGAAAAVTICCKALSEEDDEFMVFAPYFSEYKVFITSCGGKLVEVPPDYPDFQIDFNVFESLITKHTKGILLNSPNNPTGVVYTQETIRHLCEILTRKSHEYGHAIYLIADEPYKEIVYDDITVTNVFSYYPNTLVCYSYSKSLSLPGERIGYVLVSPAMEQKSDVYTAICGAARALGYVCAPSLFQNLIAKCLGKVADISLYKKNRDLLYGRLCKMGYYCVKPEGTFYLFFKALEEDAIGFCEKAKDYELLMVPGDEFGCPGYVRIAYCVSYEKVLASLPLFEKLWKDYENLDN